MQGLRVWSLVRELRSHMGLGMVKIKKKKKKWERDFSGGIVGGSPPATTGDAGSIPGPGGFHVPSN